MPERALPPASDSPEPGIRSPSGEGGQHGDDWFPDLSGLPVIGFTRRRMAFLGAAMLAGWVILGFARQVGDASAATTRLEGIAAANQQLAGQVAALDREYQLIQQPDWIRHQARAYGLGSDREIPFTLAPGAPALDRTAPGSAAVRLGAADVSVTPLESWLTLLFGPSR